MTFAIIRLSPRKCLKPSATYAEIRTVEKVETFTEQRYFVSQSKKLCACCVA